MSCDTDILGVVVGAAIVVVPILLFAAIVAWVGMRR